MTYHSPSRPAVALSVVVPVRNEADNIHSLLGEIHAALASRGNFEVVYVDDGSNDATPRQLEEARVRYPDTLTVVRHRTACGQSRAVHTGVRHAAGTWIVTLDGDGQNDPASIGDMLDTRDRLGREGQAVETILFAGRRTKRQDSWLRLLSSRVANGVRSSMLGDATPDSGCGLKLFNRATFLALPRFDHMHRFLPALMIREGGSVISVPVNHRPRTQGTSKYGLWNRLGVGIVDLAGVWWLIRRNRNPVIETVSQPVIPE